MSKWQKGPPYEREIAKKLSLWWSSGKDDTVFWRTHGSGARATSRAKKGKRTDGQYGDLCATDPSGKSFTEYFTVSIKRGYPKYNLDTLFDKPGNKKGYRTFIDEVIVQQRDARSREWLLIVKRDRCDAIVITSAGLNVGERFYPSITMNFISGGTVYYLYITKLDDFLKCITPKLVQTLHDEWRTRS